MEVKRLISKGEYSRIGHSEDVRWRGRRMPGSGWNGPRSQNVGRLTPDGLELNLSKRAEAIGDLYRVLEDSEIPGLEKAYAAVSDAERALREAQTSLLKAKADAWERSRPLTLKDVIAIRDKDALDGDK